MASFFPTADVANSRFDNDLSEDLIRGPALWIRRVLVRSQEGQLEARCDIESCRASTILDSRAGQESSARATDRIRSATRCSGVGQLAAYADIASVQAGKSGHPPLLG